MMPHRAAKGLRSALIAVALLAVPNLWLAAHADRILDGTSLWEPVFLERRIAEVPKPGRVQVIVLGNSHAMASLRPPQVAEALGLSEGAVINLALPGASAWETRHLIERYRTAFPRARRVILSVDPYLATEDLQPRAQYLTRHSWFARWDYSLRYDDLETRTRLLAGWFFPLGDHSVTLKTLAKVSPMGSVRQFVTLERQKPTSRDYATLRSPWAVPLAFDHEPPAGLEVLRDRSAKPTNRFFRATQFLGPRRDLERGLADLDRLLGAIQPHFDEVRVVESPMSPRLSRTLDHYYKKKLTRYQEGLTASAAKHGLNVTPPPTSLVDEDFYDLDHLTLEGGKKYTQWLAKAWRPAIRTSLAP